MKQIGIEIEPHSVGEKEGSFTSFNNKFDQLNMVLGVQVILKVERTQLRHIKFEVFSLSLFDNVRVQPDSFKML